ncbi:hypothetical protein HETIRDRAFT_481953 [Heterobasidion irregulare TC 32-1]|uniref:Uncharacterized protein n=1 Tax=Heterobasidion irregulare (strain TC 32-1) TaxID=747525 RepID=W4JQA7_HETIT|nr:uncharacterized protein HETIRDRAFT_481953 [Heterobasidion irregulare TC 32-1]ETW75265.1 hypothetical protein HETIRDRAFT_481953 [Heterobasidion irregulare TC 32-1]
MRSVGVGPEGQHGTTTTTSQRRGHFFCRATVYVILCEVSNGDEDGIGGHHLLRVRSATEPSFRLHRRPSVCVSVCVCIAAATYGYTFFHQNAHYVQTSYTTSM